MKVNLRNRRVIPRISGLKLVLVAVQLLSVAAITAGIGRVACSRLVSCVSFNDASCRAVLYITEYDVYF